MFVFAKQIEHRSSGDSQSSACAMSKTSIYIMETPTSFGTTNARGFIKMHTSCNTAAATKDNSTMEAKKYGESKRIAMIISESYSICSTADAYAFLSVVLVYILQVRILKYVTDFACEVLIYKINGVSQAILALL